MDTIEVSTDVYCPKKVVYDFLVDFPRYATLSDRLEDVRQEGDGTPGTNYYLTFRWWKLSYTAHSTVTDVEPPDRIDWRLTKDIDAYGSWLLTDIDSPEGKDAATEVRLLVKFDPHSAKSGALDLPRFISMSWVIEKVKPLVQGEAERVVRRLVADLEGESRPVDLDIHATPDSV